MNDPLLEFAVVDSRDQEYFLIVWDDIIIIIQRMVGIGEGDKWQ